MSAWIPISVLWISFITVTVGYLLRVRHPHGAARLRAAARLTAAAAFVLVLVWWLLRAGADMVL